jgi:hypothetical protein
MPTDPPVVDDGAVADFEAGWLDASTADRDELCFLYRLDPYDLMQRFQDEGGASPDEAATIDGQLDNLCANVTMPTIGPAPGPTPHVFPDWEMP